MVFTDDIKAAVAKTAFIPILTFSEAGEAHLIVVGKGEPVAEDTLSFGIYKMETTQKNIASTGKAQVVLVDMENGPKGFRLTGKACVEGGKVLFKAEAVEALL